MGQRSQPKHRLTIALIGLMLFMGYNLFIATGDLTIDDNCNPQGATASLRSLLQGKSWWKAQLVLLDREMTRLREFPQKRARVEAMLAHSQSTLDSFHAVHPELTRSEPTLSDRLRSAADSVEMADIRTASNDAIQRNLIYLSTCRDSVASRAGVVRRGN